MLKTAALAAALAIAAVAAPTTAVAGPHDDAIVAGALGFLGGAIVGGALAQPAPVYVEPAPIYVQPRPVVIHGADAHVAWCSAKYRSYNVYDNTWIDKHGRLRICQSPYAY
jgi:hypothetical protein